MAPSKLAPGLLLAAPRLGDPNFERSVVLLAHHDATGALGWVMNGKALVSVAQLLKDADLVPIGSTLPDTPSFADMTRVGGPVMPGSAWLLFERQPGVPSYPGEHELGDNYAMTGAREAIEAVARGQGPERFRMFLGYAGWGASQLEGEIRAGAWLPATLDVSLVLSQPSDKLWDAAYRLSVGTSPMAFTSNTRGSALRVERLAPFARALPWVKGPPMRPARLARALAASSLFAVALAACAAHEAPAPQAPCPACPPAASAPAQPPAPREGPPTVDEARAFFDLVDADLRRLFAHRETMGFVSNTYITDDTEKLSAQAEEDAMEYLSQAIKASQRFNGLELPPDLARMRTLLRLAGTTPAPSDAKERSELAGILSWMQAAYGKGKYCPPGAKPDEAPGDKKNPKAPHCKSLGELSQTLKDSRKWDELKEAWVGWHSISPPMRPKFTRYVELGNKGSREIGFKDMGDLWRSGYDMPAEAFEADVERLWSQVKPLYDDLHCYVRGKLRKQYGKDKIGDKAAIPAHLLGNMWAQEWGDIYPLVEPYAGQGSLDVTKSLQRKKYDEKRLVRLAESFFTSLGMDKLPDSFWQRSMFTKPTDHEAVCHASAWDVGYNDDLRIKMCIKIDEEDLITVHHELGHDYYFHSYYKLPILFQQGANDGFHEGIGDTLALSVTPGYLKNVGLLDKVPDNKKAEINVQMKQALEKVAFLPFGLLIDKWRWDVFSGKTAPSDYNKAWWDLRRKYQGVEAPVARSEQDFDPGAKYHVPGNTPYVRYFLARIYQFQFHRALCKAAGHKGPLSTCSIYGNKQAGEKLMAMLALGASKPWPEALAALSGETQADASAMLEYFAPLAEWLKEQNKGEQCGW